MASTKTFKQIAAIICAIALLSVACACSHNHQDDVGPTEHIASASSAPTATGEAEPSGASANPTDGAPSPTPASTSSNGAQNSPTATETAAHTTLSSDTPAPTTTSTSAPTPTPDPPSDTVWFDDSASVYCDMDFDGASERIEIIFEYVGGYTYTCRVMVMVGATETMLEAAFTAESFSKALLHNFNSGDGRVELLVCCGVGEYDHRIHAFRLNGDSDGLIESAIDGWIEGLDSGGALLVGRHLDLLGTWPSVGRFGFAADEFRLVQTDDVWTVYNTDGRVCIVSNVMLAEFISDEGTDNIAGFLNVGDCLYPTSTDMSTYIEFAMTDGRIGRLTIMPDGNGGILLNGSHPNDWFSNLVYYD